MSMSGFTESITDTRREETFLELEPAEIERARRFGQVRRYGAGEPLFKIGEVGHGMFVVLSGKVDLIREDEAVGRKVFHTSGPGSIIGELAQLAGRPALVDGYAREPVEGLHIPPD